MSSNQNQGYKVFAVKYENDFFFNYSQYITLNLTIFHR